ncbi:MAG TPA: hypothetical protein VE465_09245 [Streptosporangiaceae bacterium]|jgi:hypothetical protein|nr:hypothetical protein [Streptosporangiaceae bacterium]
MSALDDTIPAEIRFSVYLSTRLLQELQLALQLLGVQCAYVRPGVEGIHFPRLYLSSTTYETRVPDKEDAITLLDYFVCVVPLPLPVQHHFRLVPAVEWWFMWWGDVLMPICTATDMQYAARVIVDYEEPM